MSSKKKLAAFAQVIAPFVLLLLIILAIEQLAYGYDKWGTKMPDGFIKKVNIHTFFVFLEWSLLALSLLIIAFKISTNNLVRGFVTAVFMTAFMFVCLEIASVILIKSGVFTTLAPDYPKLLQQPISKAVFPKPICADINPIWGVWHYADSSTYNRDCFHVKYRKNSYGTRDTEHSLASKKERIVFLGDSFVEGFGVDEEARFANLVQNQNHDEYLNFGTSGDFGPTQYYLVYKHLAKKFSHRAVVICVFPSNDFDNDDINSEHYQYRYRPYWTGNYPNYRLTYQLNKLEDSDWYPTHIAATMLGNNHLSFQEKLIREFKRNSYFCALMMSGFDNLQKIDKNIDSKYVKYNKEEWQKMLFSLQKINKEANGKPIVIVSIPAIQDLKARQKAHTMLALSRQLQATCNKEKWLYIDLLEYFYGHSNHWEELFFDCDVHWSPKGHLLATQALINNKEYQHIVHKK